MSPQQDVMPWARRVLARLARRPETVDPSSPGFAADCPNRQRVVEIHRAVMAWSESRGIELPASNVERIVVYFYQQTGVLARPEP